MAQDIIVPEVSDGVTEGTIISVVVAVGDKVEADQTLLEMETDKAVVGIPSPFDGVITEICREHGDWFKLSAPRGGSGLLVEFSDPELALPIDRAGSRISVEGTFEALPLADPPDAETDGQRICPAMTRGALRYRLRASGAMNPAPGFRLVMTLWSGCRKVS